jgi:NAD(P)-dependent dehydrogenase (short-subunit alcohol dehydrogenase family)
LHILKVKKLGNKIVLITGASSGMGKETAKLLLSKGFIVYASARRTEQMGSLEQSGAKILKLDVTDQNSIGSAVEKIISEQGKLDVLVNNAGFGLLGAIEEVSIEQARYQMEVNVFGPSRLIQLVLPHMRAQQSGKIVNISSTSGKMGVPLSGWYSASKFAVEGLSDSLRLEVKQFGIDVVLIEPGGVRSEWGGIARKGLHNSPEGSAYNRMASKILKFSDKSESKNSDPSVIADLVLQSITSLKPKIRYHGGYMAGPILFLKKVLSDRLFDKLLMMQMK